jgi:hypothetical protein
VKYTVRFAHMAFKPSYKVGDVINRGDIIGIMGSTGQSTAAHLHIDCVEGEQRATYKLADIGTRLMSSKKQLDYFIDKELFGVLAVVTTGYLDAEYKKIFGKDHPAYDVVPIDRFDSKDHFAIHWNRSKAGTVSLIVDQPSGYGHCMYVTFEA